MKNKLDKIDIPLALLILFFVVAVVFLVGLFYVGQTDSSTKDGWDKVTVCSQYCWAKCEDDVCNCYNIEDINDTIPFQAEKYCVGIFDMYCRDNYCAVLKEESVI